MAQIQKVLGVVQIPKGLQASDTHKISMEEKSPPRSRSKNRAHKARPRRSSRSTTNTATASSSSSSRNQGRFRRAWEGEETENCSIECSGKSYQACSVTLVADCMALCCCPLALVSLLGRRNRKDPKDGPHHHHVEAIGKGVERSRDIVF